MQGGQIFGCPSGRCRSASSMVQGGYFVGISEQKGFLNTNYMEDRSSRRHGPHQSSRQALHNRLPHTRTHWSVTGSGASPNLHGFREKCNFCTQGFSRFLQHTRLSFHSHASLGRAPTTHTHARLDAGLLYAHHSTAIATAIDNADALTIAHHVLQVHHVRPHARVHPLSCGLCVVFENGKFEALPGVVTELLEI